MPKRFYKQQPKYDEVERARRAVLARLDGYTGPFCLLCAGQLQQFSLTVNDGPGNWDDNKKVFMPAPSRYRDSWACKDCGEIYEEWELKSESPEVS